MTGRTVQKHFRVYADGYDLSGAARSIGPFGVTVDEAEMTTWTDTVKTYLKNHSQLDLGDFNGVFDNTATSGIHAVLGTSGVQRTVTVAMGMRAAPVQGDPIFAGQFLQTGYQATDDGGATAVTIPFAGWSGTADTRFSNNAFGVLLHARAAATGANSSSGVDNGAATAAGGYMVYHILAGDGDAELEIEDSANNSDWASLSGATTGNITMSSPLAGIVALSNTATVRQYLRWQLTLDTATTVTFVLSFIRG